MLIRRMGGTFKDDDVYRNGLRLLLSDPTAQQIEQHHLKSVRHNAVFHFDVDVFRETLNKANLHECLFVASASQRRTDMHYTHADIVAAEILVGHPAGKDEFTIVLADAAAKTDKLVTSFIESTEALISHHLQRWDFTSRHLPLTKPASPEGEPPA